MQHRNIGELPGPLARERRLRRPVDPNEGLALDWINRYKATTFSVLLGTSSETVLQTNPLRTYLLVQNLSAVNRVFIAFNSSAIVNNSVLIIPEGNYELIGGELGGSFCPQDSVNLVANAANTRVAIVEGTLLPYNQVLRD